MKKMITCPRCRKSFKTRQGLGNHLRFCQTVKEPVKKVDLPAPRSATRSPAQSAPGKSFSNEDRIRESLTWGIARRGRRWQVIPMLYGMSYEEAEAAAERRNRIPFTPVRRQVRVREEEDTKLALGLLLLELNRSSQHPTC